MQRISEVTRRNVIDALVVSSAAWCGRLGETDFLSRLYDLDRLPSTDHRFKTAVRDIIQHRVMNSDWEPDWVYYDARFELLRGDDEVFLRFLCEMLHPVVRPDPTEVEQLHQLFNQHLLADGFQIVEKARLSGRPVFVGRYTGLLPTPGVHDAKDTLRKLDPGYVYQQITRMETAVAADPDLAIGTAKELVETCCKTILEEHSIPFSASDDLPSLARRTLRALALTPDDIPEKTQATETIRRLLMSLATVVQGLCELRGRYGTGHGRRAGTKGLTSRHAKLAVGAASTLAVFLVETHALGSSSASQRT